jgi:hypothetical protein
MIDVTKITKSLEGHGNDVELAEFAGVHFKDIKTTNNSQKAYIWHTESLLWKEISQKHLHLYVAREFRSLVERIDDEYRLRCDRLKDS